MMNNYNLLLILEFFFSFLSFKEINDVEGGVMHSLFLIN